MKVWLVILCVLLFLICVISIFTYFHVKNKEGYNKNCNSYIIKKFNDTTYNSDGSPNGGILISLFDHLAICPNYKYKISSDTDSSCQTKSNQCTTENAILNPGDISQVLTANKKHGSGTNCFHMATTYFRRDMPQYVFGPYRGSDMTVGIIIDPQIIFDYIACMFPIDSGSIERYNTKVIDDEFDTYLKNTSQIASKLAWKDYITTEGSKALGMAGCGIMNGYDMISGVNNASEYLLSNDKIASDHLKEIKNLKGNKLTEESWSLTDNNKPFDKYQWSKWVEATKTLFSLSSKQGKEFIHSQMNENNGYRENEVDIYVPNKDNLNANNINSVCEVTEDFKKVFASALIGIVSVAEDNSSTTPSISKHGPGGFGCVDYKTCEDPLMSKDLGATIGVYDCLEKENSCYNAQTGKCYEAQDTNTKCCGNVSLSESLAKQLAKNWNKSKYRRKYGGTKIKAYKMRVQNIYDFNYKMNQEKNLNITEI